MARGQGDKDTPYIRVVGQSSVTVAPDMAVVSIQVSSTKPSATAARDDGAELTNSTLNALSELNGLNQTTDISTTNVNIQPKIEYNQQTGESKILGYTFSQDLQINVNDLESSLLSDVIDAAITVGGNSLTLNSVTLQVSPSLQHEVMKQARGAAVKDAADTAALLADAAGVTLGAPIRIVDNNQAPVPVSGGGGGTAAYAAKMATPISVGTTTVDASVSVEYNFTTAQ